MSRPAPSLRSDYVAFYSLPTRWADNDEYGHMNNGTYLSLFDTALSLWQIDQGIAIQGPDAARFLVVENGCRYHKEAGFPDLLHAGLRIGHLGRSSLRFDIGLFRNEESEACTEGFFAQVLVDAHGQPSPIPDSMRRLYEKLM